jgi:hypothetical protein
MAALEELVSTAQAGRSSPDNGNPFPGRRSEGDDPSLVAALVVHCKGLQFAAQHRGMLFVEYTRALAQRLVRADTAANLGQGAGLVVKAGCI